MCELLRFTVRLPPVSVRLDYPDLSAEGARSEHEISVRREITFSTNTGPERYLFLVARHLPVGNCYSEQVVGVTCARPEYNPLAAISRLPPGLDVSVGEMEFRGLTSVHRCKHPTLRVRIFSSIAQEQNCLPVRRPESKTD